MSRPIATSVLFVNVGWSESYDGSPVIGKHAYLRSARAKRIGSSEDKLFMRSRGGYYHGPIGSGAVPPGTLDVVYVARHPSEGGHRIVALYFNVEALDDNWNCRSRDVLRLPVGRRPAVSWPGAQGLRRWAKNGQFQTWDHPPHDLHSAYLNARRGGLPENVWLYHINPSKGRFDYGWDKEEPRTLVGSADKVWPAANMFKQVAVGDLVFVYLKEMAGYPDGAYVAGEITAVREPEGCFRWRCDRGRSAKLLMSPITTPTLRRFFGRGFGNYMQRLSSTKRGRWLSLLDGQDQGDIIEGVPVVTVKTSARSGGGHGNPIASKEHGALGERFVVGVLRRRFPKAEGYRVVHVAARKPSSDHDIAVQHGKRIVRLVEVKTRVGVPNDPVLISENELRCRKGHRGKHSIFIVYLRLDGTVDKSLELRDDDTFTLSPRQHWLWPA